MTKTRIAVDMDEVIADSIARFHEWYGLDFQLRLSLDQLRGKHFHQAVAAEHQAALQEYPNRPGFFKDLPLIADSQRVLREISQRHELFIATAAMEFPNSFLDKYEWLQQHFSFIPWRNIVFCGDKSILNADYLIDDNAFNFDHFRGEGILFDAPHNAAETRYRRVRSWQEVADLFL
ncbi:5' nucleotidase, NT5C type [Hymenobacter glacieicola]|uniref:5'(3')-deoxyribonucleotidase n=1 Tax=Hymenobacter glacieicola TaxID=1562124 RepID=A0ABQ1X3Y4_9BACT|nr:5'-3'-deoxyribonucleotidase [Hymenobacter glacieicola]GGG58766.1 putative 5'(3')-deoxyribonucleotidase [Hymenobacter glacieicola]